MVKPVLVLGDEDDPHTVAVVEQLSSRDVPHVSLDVWSLWDPVTLSISDNGIHPCFRNLPPFRSLWVRLKPRPGGGLSEAEAFAVRERREFLMGAVSDLCPEAMRINDPWKQESARNKILQLNLARRLGLPVPKTLISNDPIEIRSFLQSFPAGIIYKPLTWLASLDGRMLFTNSISERQIVEGKDSIRCAPGIYQERLQKLYEYRVTIVDNHVFSVRIHSQQLDSTLLDWRRNQEDVVYDVVELPVSLAEKLILLNRTLGLRYSAIDLVESPDNSFVFLEANPAGQWLWLEKRIGIPVSATLGTALSTLSDV